MTGRRSRAEKPRQPVPTYDLLAAVAAHGASWPAQFEDREIVDVIEAVDREHIAGNLLDAVTLSDQGRTLIGRTAPASAEPHPVG